MPTNRTGPVSAIVRADGWSMEVRAAVLASLDGQVSRIIAIDDETYPDSGSVLIVTRPVIFAQGAIARLRRIAAQPGRVVTRVLVPNEEPDSAALWSARWLMGKEVPVSSLGHLGLGFDRAHLSHDDPHVRGWVRADDVGVARCQDVAKASQWAWAEGLRLRWRGPVAAVRGLLGRLRRRRSLAQQRRRHVPPIRDRHVR